MFIILVETITVIVIKFNMLFTNAEYLSLRVVDKLQQSIRMRRQFYFDSIVSDANIAQIHFHRQHRECIVNSINIVYNYASLEANNFGKF